MMTEHERAEVVHWFDANRRYSRRLFDSVRERAYHARPIALRQPIVFYEGHFAAFNVSTLIKGALKRSGVDERLETLFERRIDPENETAARNAENHWPDQATVQEFVGTCDRLVREALDRQLFPDDEPVWTILEHEAMHHETLRYMFHRLPFEVKASLAGRASPTGVEPPEPRTVRIPRGTATLGTDRATSRFGWDNEFDEHRVEVPEFAIDVYNVTNAQFLRFVEAGGYRNRDLWNAEGWAWREHQHVEHPIFWERSNDKWVWRGMHRYYPLPAAWPVYVTLAEASAFARWNGRRIASEPEYHRAAFGTPAGEERRFPWGDELPSANRGNFGNQFDDPVPVGSHPAGQSAWGVHDLVGNGWEWTSSPFEPFPGFTPMRSYPAYSMDFFDGKHYVLKGGSPTTPRSLIRRSFRNWFRPTYPYVYAKFRCAE